MSEVECKIFLKDGSDNNFMVGSQLDFDEKTFAENSQNFPDYQSARIRYDELTASFPHCGRHDEIEEDLQKAIAASELKTE
tara:strand:- start:392 stop:634 length:243 start_codon:yes stop_codon:yes gene_type:complete